MRNRRILSAIAPLLAAACATAPSYERPSPPETAQGHFVTRSGAFDPAMPVPDDWWRLYDDPALSALVEQALAANTDLRVAEANLAKARAVVQENRAGRLPETDLSGGVTYGDSLPSGATTGDAQFSTTAGAAVSWEVDLFGRISQAIRAAEADAQARQAARDAVRVMVAAETTRSYLDACSLGLARDVAAGSAQTSEEALDLTMTLERAGAAAQLDVERAAALSARARSELPSVEAQRQAALFELAALLGTTPANVPSAARECAVPPELAVSALPVGDAASLLRRRPDLREAERTLAADTARIGVATADLYPRITLGGSGNFLRNDNVQGDDSFSFSLGPLISWSFPNMAVARARLRQAEAQGDAALATFDGAVLTALKEVEQALARVANEEERQRALQEAAERSENAYRMADQRYRAGSLAYLDVLVAQRDLLDARAANAASIQRLGSARVDLFKALGGGWQTPPDQADPAVN